METQDTQRALEEFSNVALSAGTGSRTTALPTADVGGPPAPETQVVHDVARCPHCGARRHHGDLKCRFCGDAFDAAPEPPRAPEPANPEAAGKRRRNRILTLGALVLLDAFLLYPSKQSAPEPVIGPEDLCQGNLLLLQDAFARAQSAGTAIPVSTGSEFWRELAAFPSPSPTLTCPLSHPASRYRGPARPWHELADNGVILADLSDGHVEGGWVLYKNGTSRRVARGSPVYQQVLAESKE